MKKILPIVLLVFPTALFVVGYLTWQAFAESNQMDELVAQIKAPHESEHSTHLTAATEEPFILTLGESTFMIPVKLLATWRESYIRPWTGKQEYRLKQEEIMDYLDELAPRVNTAPVQARFTFSEGTLQENIPARNGAKLEHEGTVSNILRAMSAGHHTTELAVLEIPPTMNLERLAQLGITTRLSEGQSTFTGSPNFRMHNIRIGAKRFDGLIIEPGQEFSFNERLGEVDANTGYLPELVIKGDKLIPEYGGGICQVSTTMFRAAMEAGLPILERHAHSLPVRYYNPQGYDSTIYPGVVDLRFKNDTPSAILVQTRVEGTKIFFEFYGQSDGRVTTIEGPYTYDAQPDGSLKAIVSQVVTTADGSNKKTFYSSYKSPGLFQIIRNPLE